MSDIPHQKKYPHANVVAREPKELPRKINNDAIPQHDVYSLAMIETKANLLPLWMLRRSKHGKYGGTLLVFIKEKYEKVSMWTFS